MRVLARSLLLASPAAGFAFWVGSCANPPIPVPAESDLTPVTGKVTWKWVQPVKGGERLMFQLDGVQRSYGYYSGFPDYAVVKERAAEGNTVTVWAAPRRFQSNETFLLVWQLADDRGIVLPLAVIREQRERLNQKAANSRAAAPLWAAVVFCFATALFAVAQAVTPRRRPPR